MIIILMLERNYFKFLNDGDIYIMPTLYKPKKKKIKHFKNIDVSKVYNNNRWIKLRKQKLEDCPLCEICMAESEDGIVNVNTADEVHHIIPILQKPELAYDYKNLMSLCSYHHHQIHKDMHKKKNL